VEGLSNICTLGTVGTLRIGELARRTSLSPEVLRAWERRYGLLRPARTTGGYRLYSEEDAERVLRMQELISSGIAAAEAARLALEDPPAAAAADDLAADLRSAVDAFDEARAHQAFDRLLARLSVEAVLGQAVLPFLHELGERWERGEATVAQEHFASQFLRGRLLGLARGWDRGVGPRAVLACVPGEQHDLPLVVFGIALREHGWRITFLGADTPVETLVKAASTLAPAAVVVSATQQERLEASARALAAAARDLPLWVGGAGATAALAKRAGAQLLENGALEEAARLAAAAAARA
jgi:MerR family transcriptional regulator, light-induced transcriptional regulator